MGMARAAVSAIYWAWNGPKSRWESRSLPGRVRTRAQAGGKYQNLHRTLGRLLVDREEGKNPTQHQHIAA